MNYFILYLHTINKIRKQETQMVNILKRIHNVITNYTKEYDNIDFLITDKFKVTSWMMKNLKASTISVNSISLQHAVASMDIEENKKRKTSFSI